jgi:ABC-type glycerol-3-phosphate transport system permease component
MQAMINSFVVTIPTAAITLALASMAAFALSRYRIPLRRSLLLPTTWPTAWCIAAPTCTTSACRSRGPRTTTPT